MFPVLAVRGISYRKLSNHSSYVRTVIKGCACKNRNYVILIPELSSVFNTDVVLLRRKENDI